MAIFQEIITYFFLFVTIYAQVVLLSIYYTKRKQIAEDEAVFIDHLPSYPTVTIIVPCFNEENTIKGTLESLLALDYPKDKLRVIAVDDGSKDNTWNVMQEYKDNPQIEVIHKENGGKFTALNLGIEKSTSDFIGCLDADSFVDKMTLKKIMKRFLDDPEVMAITPALRIHGPNSLARYIQSAEYHLGILAKKVQSLLGAIHVTPGPFSIFRKEVFEKIGKFKHAHNLEDMEMAFRMQANHLKIGNVHNAWVYTVGPKSFKALYKQRLRWTHGFLENSKDYKYMYFNKKYGNIAFLTLPTALLFIVAVVFTVAFVIYRLIMFSIQKFIQVKTVGFILPNASLSWFYISTRLTVVLSIIVFLLTLSLLMNAQKLVEGKAWPGKRIILFFVLYPLVSPFWVLKSIYNSIFGKRTSWR